MHTFESGTHNFTWKCPSYYETIDHFLKTILELKALMVSTENNTYDTPTDIPSYQSIDLEAIEKMPLIAQQIQNDDPSNNESNRK